MKLFVRLGISTLGLILATGLPLRAQEIVLGQYASLTGSEATFGINSSNGVALALEEVNKTGVLGGRKIKIITEDDQSKPRPAFLRGRN